MKSVRDIGNVESKRIFLRVDFNVPFVNDTITDDFRIRKTLPVIDFLINKGAIIIVGSHHEKEKTSLRPVFKYLENKYSRTYFVEDFFPNLPTDLKSSPPGSIIFLDNLRKYSGEKANDENYAKHLASFADFYVNEAFSVSHRKHASVISVPKFLPSFAGFVFGEEAKNLRVAFNPTHPFLFILGGAKFDTKIPLVKKFFNLADKVFMGGALANDFLKAKGYNVGRSLLSSSIFHLEEYFNSEKLIMPADLRVRGERGILIKPPHEIEVDEVIVDIGPESIEALGPTIQEARLILWNGPLGNYEIGFKDSTIALAQKIAESKATSIVGGGDTVASIASLGVEGKFTFVSTGGGAMLDFLANETLPGIEALNSSIH